MVKSFIKTSEGVAEYQKLKMPYEDELYDTAYEKYLTLTRKTPPEAVKIEYTNVVRIIAPGGERQYITHDETTTRQDPLGNIKMFYRGGLEVHPKPILRYEVRVNEEEGYVKEKYIAGIDNVETVYDIPFSKQNADKLYKFCTENTSFVIKKGLSNTDLRIKVDSFKDWRDGDVEELLRVGHIASSYERQKLLEERQGKVDPPQRLYR